MEITWPTRDHLMAPWRRMLARAAQPYVVGPELPDAIGLAQRLSKRGAATTLCYWNSLADSPAQLARIYIQTLRALSAFQLNSYLSIKAPALNFDHQVIGDILAEAHSHGIRVHFDALEWETADLTFAIIEKFRTRYSLLGCTLPGRWRRSMQDAERARRLDVDVRVVKGQWPDPHAPDSDLRRGFLDVVDALAGSRRLIGIASHDPSLASLSLAKLRKAGTPCELELLHGLPAAAVLKQTRSLDVPIRYYLPFGHAWLPYAMRQAIRKPQILWWLLRDSLADRKLTGRDSLTSDCSR